MILLHSFSIHLFFLWVKFLSCITIVSQPINNNFKRCWSFFITFWNLSRPKVILDVESNVTSLHSKKRWVVFSTQMLGWDRWVRALGCFRSGYILANRLPTTSSNRQSKLWYTPITNTRWVTRKAQCYFLFSQHGTIERHKARGLRSKRRGTS